MSHPYFTLVQVDTMPCTTITIKDTGTTPGEEEPPKPEDIDFFLILAGAAIIIILIFKR